MLMSLKLNFYFLVKKLFFYFFPGAYVNSCNSHTGATALHIAVESLDSPEEFEELLLCFLKYNIDMNSVALTGDTALNRALLRHR